MQDAAQYGAVEASSPPPPKRFGRKTVVALAALGLAGVAALGESNSTTKILLSTSRAAANTTPVLGLYLPVELLQDPDRLRARWSPVAHRFTRRKRRHQFVQHVDALVGCQVAK